MHYESWCSLPDDELARRDIAEVNLAAAFGLPQAERLDIQGERRKIDRLSEAVERATRRLLPRFKSSSSIYDGTLGRFRMLALVTVVQRDFGVLYNLAFSEGDYNPSDSRDLFIHGPVNGHGGTCCTMPVLYTAVGRRLGYPLKLVFAREHVFCRWDGADERFNIEATSHGFNPRPDDYYRTWPKPISSEELREGIFLRSITPREELAMFIDERGKCWMYNAEFRLALEAFHYAVKLAPKNGCYRGAHAVATIAYRIATRLSEMRLPMNHAELVMLGVPPAREEWEQWATPHAIREIRQIMRLQKAKRRMAAHSVVFAGVDNE